MVTIEPCVRERLARRLRAADTVSFKKSSNIFCCVARLAIAAWSRFTSPRSVRNAWFRAELPQTLARRIAAVFDAFSSRVIPRWLLAVARGLGGAPTERRHLAHASPSSLRPPLLRNRGASTARSARRNIRSAPTERASRRPIAPGLAKTRELLVYGARADAGLRSLQWRRAAAADQRRGEKNETAREFMRAPPERAAA